MSRHSLTIKRWQFDDETTIEELVVEFAYHPPIPGTHNGPGGQGRPGEGAWVEILGAVNNDGAEPQPVTPAQLAELQGDETAEALCIKAGSDL